MIDEASVLLSVAGNCARLRKGRQMTFDALAKRSGVSKGMLVEIEQGRTNPSIATLCRMANAFGVALGEVLSQEETTARLLMHERDAGRVLWETKAGSCARLIDTFRLNGLAAETWRWHLAPGEHFDGAAHPQGTIEVLSILRGTLNVEAGNEARTGRPGSTVRFAAEVPHRYGNVGSGACEFQMLVLEPIG